MAGCDQSRVGWRMRGAPSKKGSRNSLIVTVRAATKGEQALTPHPPQWYKVNDSNTSRMQAESVVSGDAYLLFYVRKDLAGAFPR